MHLAGRSPWSAGLLSDGSRSFEEIDRMAIGVEGTASLLSSIATVDFYRGIPPSGFTKACPHNDARTRAMETSLRKFAARISTGTSLIILQPLRRGRHWPKRPTICRLWYRVATTAA